MFLITQKYPFNAFCSVWMMVLRWNDTKKVDKAFRAAQLHLHAVMGAYGFSSSPCAAEIILSYVHIRCINPPACMLICSICCKLHYPCSQHGFLCIAIITGSFEFSAAISARWAREFSEHVLGAHFNCSLFHLFCPFVFFLFSFIPSPPALILVFLTSSSLSPPHTHSLTLSLLLRSTDAWKARFHSVSHPILVNLSPTHKPIAHMRWPVREGLSIKGMGVCYASPLLAPWLQGHKGCLAAPGTEHLHYSLPVHLLL